MTIILFIKNDLINLKCINSYELIKMTIKIQIQTLSGDILYETYHEGHLNHNNKLGDIHQISEDGDKLISPCNCKGGQK